MQCDGAAFHLFSPYCIVPMIHTYRGCHITFVHCVHIQMYPIPLVVCCRGRRSEEEE